MQKFYLNLSSSFCLMLLKCQFLNLVFIISHSSHMIQILFYLLRLKHFLLVGNAFGSVTLVGLTGMD